VTCFLRHKGRILVLRRSHAVSTHKGKWAGISGTIATPTPLQQALKEIQEETGLTSEEVVLLRRSDPLDVPDPENKVTWVVHPFLFAVRGSAEIRLDWEHTEARWIEPHELTGLEAVPRLKESWEQLWKTP